MGTWLQDQDFDFSHNVIIVLEYGWSKFTNVAGDYVKKKWYYNFHVIFANISEYELFERPRM